MHHSWPIVLVLGPLLLLRLRLLHPRRDRTMDNKDCSSGSMRPIASHSLPSIMPNQPPPNAAAHTVPPLAFNDCTLTPNGVDAMVAHLRALPVLRDLPVSRVRAAAIALITFGGSSDGRNNVGRTGLHDAHFAAHASNAPTTWRHGLRDDYMRMLMDLVCLCRYTCEGLLTALQLTWHDRVSGGASLLMSTQGTRRPGSIVSITEVKMDVFLSISLRNQIGMDATLSRMVQRFAEEVGFPAMQRFDRAKSFGRKAPVTTTVAPRKDSQPLIPPSDTTWYTFYGRAPGALDQLISSPIAATQSAVPQLPPAPPGHGASSPQTDSAPWTTENVEFYAAQLRNCAQHDDAARRAIIEQVSLHLPDVFAVVFDLQ